jgi:hypothetical protein
MIDRKYMIVMNRKEVIFYHDCCTIKQEDIMVVRIFTQWPRERSTLRHFYVYKSFKIGDLQRFIEKFENRP